MDPAARRLADNQRMIRDQIVARGIRDQRVLDAIRRIPRDLFVPSESRREAWDDTPLPLGFGQTISQPFIVAYMTEALQLRGDERVLEIGAGSGYQTAILAQLVRQVFAAELEPALMQGAAERIKELDIANVEFRSGNGIEVFRDRAPFEAILSAAAPQSVPQALLDQLADGGRCIIPVGGDYQSLWLIRRAGDEFLRRELDPVRFVPLREKAGEY